MQIRNVKVDHKNPPRWSSLSKEAKERHNIVARYAIEFVKRNGFLSWEELDKQLPHLYSWTIENYNASHQKTRIEITDEGLKLYVKRRDF